MPATACIAEQRIQQREPSRACSQQIAAERFGETYGPAWSWLLIAHKSAPQSCFRDHIERCRVEQLVHVQHFTVASCSQPLCQQAPVLVEHRHEALQTASTGEDKERAVTLPLRLCSCTRVGQSPVPTVLSRASACVCLTQWTITATSGSAQSRRQCREQHGCSPLGNKQRHPRTAHRAPAVVPALQVLALQLAACVCT